LSISLSLKNSSWRANCFMFAGNSGPGFVQLAHYGALVIIWRVVIHRSFPLECEFKKSQLVGKPKIIPC
jgi:hypothetical protein